MGLFFLCPLSSPLPPFSHQSASVLKERKQPGWPTELGCIIFLEPTFGVNFRVLIACGHSPTMTLNTVNVVQGDKIASALWPSLTSVLDKGQPVSCF